MRRVLNDLALGVRLAVGGGRTSLARFVLSSIGIAVAVAVLLVAASVGTMTHERALRNLADLASETPIPGVDPVYARYGGTEFRGESVRAMYVHPASDRSPVPIGLPKLPGPGEMYASPALVELLGSADGELLRPRFPEKIVGTIDNSMVPKPGDLIAYVGADARLADADADATVKIYKFGMTLPTRELDPAMSALLLVGAVALLLPVFLFVSTASRIAGAERDRRLSALRLVGSGARQVRRIAAAEALVSAFAGLVLGALVFAVARQFAEQISLFGTRVYVSDVVPHPALVVFIVIAVPAMSVLSALFALRRTIIEPLGVVRQGKPIRRRLWWRLALIALGVGLLITQAGFEENTDLWGYAIAAGASLVLIGVPVLLPWLVERVAGRLRGGPTSWQLAIRRLQLDSGTSARVVGSVAVVLSGAIALQTVLMTAEADVALPAENSARPPGVGVSTEAELTDKVMADLRAASGVTGTYQVHNATAYEQGNSEDNSVPMAVLDCAALRALADVKECTNGDVFQVRDEHLSPVPAGTKMEFREYTSQAEIDYKTIGTWTIPQNPRPINRPPTSGLYAQLLITPAAINGTTLSDWRATVITQVADNLTTNQLEGIRNAVAGYSWQVYVYSYNTAVDLTARQRVFVSIRTALYAGSIFTLLLAGVSLLVLALEHIRERRRPLAVLAASGVPRAVLGRSLLLQITLPIALGVVVALLTGIGLASLILRLTGQPISLDWPGIALLCTGAMALSVLVATMTLPFLRNATRLTSLRAE